MAETQSPPPPTLEDFPHRTFDKLRYGDTDRQGHVNNAISATMFETGRVELLIAPDVPLLSPGYSFVIANITIDYIDEILWPGSVEIGTRVTKIGRSSIGLDQGLFQEGRLVGAARSVIVMTDESTRRSHPLPDAGRTYLESYSIR
ncbi:MAG: acyl-CoA thioesterase [Rhodospirillaceae bacterium]